MKSFEELRTLHPLDDTGEWTEMPRDHIQEIAVNLYTKLRGRYFTYRVKTQKGDTIEKRTEIREIIGYRLHPEIDEGEDKTVFILDCSIHLSLPHWSIAFRNNGKDTRAYLIMNDKAIHVRVEDRLLPGVVTYDFLLLEDSYPLKGDDAWGEYEFPEKISVPVFAME
jgi:signal peptidase I